MAEPSPSRARPIPPPPPPPPTAPSPATSPSARTASATPSPPPTPAAGATSISPAKPILLQAAGGAPIANPGPQQPSAPLKLKTHTFTDPAVKNIPSHTVLVPEGWTVKGGPFWANPNYFNVLPSQNITVTSPDGVEVEIGPSIAFKEFQQNPAAGLNMPRQKEWQPDDGYPVMFMPENAQAWATWLETRGIPQTYPDATNIKVLDISVVQEMMPAMRAIVAPMQQASAQLNQGYGNHFADGYYYAAQIRFDRNGKTWEQLTGFGVYWLGSQYEFGRQLWWGIEGGRSFTAPAGEMQKNIPVLMAIADSVRTTPQWNQNRNQLAATLRGITAKGAADRARQNADAQAKIRQTYNETSDIIAKSYDVNAGGDSQRNYINAINEVEDYRTPGGNQVQLPSGYTNVYTNNRNEYLMTNDVLNHPNVQNLGAGDWQQMQNAR